MRNAQAISSADAPAEVSPSSETDRGCGCLLGGQSVELLDHLDYGPVGDSFPVGEAAALDDQPLDQSDGLGDEARLTHARLADDRDQLATLFGTRSLPRRLDQRQFLLSPDEAGLVAALRRSPRREQPESRHRLRLALEHKRLDRFHLNGAANERERWFPDQRLPRLRRLLQPGGDVDCIPGRKALLGAGDDLARGDPDAALDVELGQDLAHLDRRPAGAQGIIFVRDGHPEDRHDSVADELLDRATVALDNRLHPLEVAGKERPECFRVGRLPERRRADDVAEEHRYDLALLRGPCGRRGPALRAELEGLGGLVAANSTSGHEPSLGTRSR